MARNWPELQFVDNSLLYFVLSPANRIFLLQSCEVKVTPNLRGATFTEIIFSIILKLIT